jgi:hypothetical protein
MFELLVIGKKRAYLNFFEVEYLRDLSRVSLLIGKLKNELRDAIWNLRRWHER